MLSKSYVKPKEWDDESLCHYKKRERFDKRAVKIDIPKDVVHLEDICFYGNEKIRTVAIHGKVRSFGTSAFERCKSL